MSTLRSPLSSAPISTLLGGPARRTTWHSVMPRAMPPAKAGAGGAPGVSGSRRSGTGAVGVRAGAAGGEPAGIGAPARSPATEPTERSAVGGSGAASAAAVARAGSGAADASAAQRPSALTRSSGATGPLGPSRMSSFRLPGVAHSGASKTRSGFENMPLYVSASSSELLEQPAAASAAAHISPILRATRANETPDEGRAEYSK